MNRCENPEHHNLNNSSHDNKLTQTTSSEEQDIYLLCRNYLYISWKYSYLVRLHFRTAGTKLYIVKWSKYDAVHTSKTSLHAIFCSLLQCPSSFLSPQHSQHDAHKHSEIMSTTPRPSKVTSQVSHPTSLQNDLHLF